MPRRCGPVLFFFAVALAIVLAACTPAPASSPSSATGAPATAGKSLRIAFNNPVLQPGISFLWIGKQLGYMDEENLSVEFVPTSGAGEATQLLAAGKADIALPQLGPMLEAAAQGQDLGLIGIYLLNRKIIYELVVPPDSPIQSYTDFKGKKIGKISEVDEADYVYRAMMTELGYPPESNQLINTGAAVQAAEALKNHTVDLEIWADVQRALTQAQGYQWRSLPAPPFFDKVFSNVVLVRKDYLAQNREAVVAYLRVLAKSTLFLTTNPAAALRIHFQMYPQTLPTGQSIDQAVQANLISTDVRVPKLVPGPGEKWGEMSASNWDYYVRTYLGYGPDKIKDVSQFYTNDLIGDLNKFDPQKVVDQAKTYPSQ
jgi:NitT/TauT family transport system substrate-binding protein